MRYIQRHLLEKEEIALVQQCINHYLQSQGEAQRAMAFIDDFLRSEKFTLDVCTTDKSPAADTTISRYIERKFSHS